MAREVEEPKLIGEEEHHPAYGKIACFRSNGSTVLYGSDFVHEHSVTIEISRSVLTRSSNHDHPYSAGRVLTLRMSEAQWAAFVGSMGQGDGTQCTLEWVGGKHIPGIPAPKDRKAQFDFELRERLQKAVEAIEEAKRAINNSSMTKKLKDELLSSMHQAKMNIESNAGYVADCFNEHMEKTVTQAKTEIHGHMQNVLQRAGLSALQNVSMPLLIEEPQEGEKYE